MCAGNKEQSIAIQIGVLSCSYLLLRVWDDDSLL